MSVRDKTIHLCSCNGTMPIDAHALARALELAGPLPLYTELCQKELTAFADHAQGDVLVACTQEAHMFGEVADDAAHSGKVQSIRFVNIRETAGWSTQARAATPKIAALLALAALPESEPVPRVAFKSEGQLLIAGPAELALAWARRLQGQTRRLRLDHRRRRTDRIAAAAQLPGLFGQARAHRWLARCV